MAEQGDRMPVVAMNVHRGLAVAGVVIAVLSGIGLWQSDRAMSDETLRQVVLYCDYTGASDAFCRDARNELAMWTAGFWASIVFLVVGLVLIVLALTRPSHPSKGEGPRGPA